jgi:hypothetical protein
MLVRPSEAEIFFGRKMKKWDVGREAQEFLVYVGVFRARASSRPGCPVCKRSCPTSGKKIGPTMIETPARIEPCGIEDSITVELTDLVLRIHTEAEVRGCKLQPDRAAERRSGADHGRDDTTRGACGFVRLPMSG